MRHHPDQPPPSSAFHSWVNRFRFAGRGVLLGMRGQPSFAVHLFIAAAVILLAALLQLASWQWCVVILCIGLVLAMELFNTVVERLTRILHPAHDPEIGELLDIAAGAVLVVAIAAAVCGFVVLLPELWEVLP